MIWGIQCFNCLREYIFNRGSYVNVCACVEDQLVMLNRDHQQTRCYFRCAEQCCLFKVGEFRCESSEMKIAGGHLIRFYPCFDFFRLALPTLCQEHQEQKIIKHNLYLVVVNGYFIKTAQPGVYLYISCNNFQNYCVCQELFSTILL